MSKSNYHKKIGRQGWNDDEHTRRSDIDAFYDEDMLESSSTGKKRSKKKSKKKSDHKHKYVEVIGIFNTDILGRPHRSGVLMKRCSICGKIDGWKHPTIKDSDSYFSRMMTLDEILKTYKDLEVVEFK